ncbi:ADP-ribosylglycohydrolase family protein [Nannocystis pusilla]|uniref:ADP-ribosylglycohydrolase family protein n=1 Tax=Nannocystis pusilla TaxID=889268 RepID=UPI003B839CB5
MRIAPLALFTRALTPAEIVRCSMEVSGLTHAHPRSQLCCAYFSLLLALVVQGWSLQKAMAQASRHLAPFVPDEERDVLKEFSTGRSSRRRRRRSAAAATWCIASRRACGARRITGVMKRRCWRRSTSARTPTRRRR